MSEKFFAEPQRIGPLAAVKAKQELGAGAGRIPAWPIAGWDPTDGYIKILNLGVLVEPLVNAERLHILGIIDGREEDYDLQTLVLPNGSAVGASVSAQLEVPSGEVWFVNSVEMVLPADAGGSPTMNWHCDLWTDRVGSSAFGQPFHPAAVNFTPGGGTQWDDFHYAAPLWVPGNKQEVLRLPAGATITFVAANTVALSVAAMTCIGRIYGWIGKKIV